MCILYSGCFNFFCNMWFVCVSMGFVMCGCVYIRILYCVGVLICVLVFTLYIYCFLCILIPCILLFNSANYVFLFLCLYVLIIMYVLFGIFCFHRANRHPSATLTDDFTL